MKIFILLVTVLLCLTCCKETQESSKAVEYPQTDLTNEQYASIGYVVKVRGEGRQSEWDKGQFGEAVVIFTRIKSTTETKLGSQTYPRFKIIRERYAGEDMARKRLVRLRDFDPTVINKFKNTDHVLRRGFYIKDEVVIVTTDAVMFSYRYLDEVTIELRFFFRRC